MKRIFILCAALAGLLPLAAEAQVNYAVSGTTAYVTNSPNATGNILIASTYEGYPVTSIAAGAFDGCPYLTSVTISNSVTSIGANAFSFCSSLTNIAVIAGNPDYSSANGVLFNKNQTLLIQFPQFPIVLGGSYTIPNSVTSIGDDAFEQCALTNVTIPNNVTNIGDYAFYDCGLMTSVTIGNSVTSIGDDAFAECNMTSVTIPNSVTSIGAEAFYNCSSLAKVTIGNSVTSIGYYAFAECSLTSVTIPNSVTSIGVSPFVYCYSLTNIAVSAGNPDYSSVNGVLFNQSQTLLIQFPDGLGGSYTISNSVTGIADYAFYGASRLTSVTIGNSVTSIGYYAFYGCGLMTSVTIGNSVTNIEEGAFSYCSSLTSITFQGNAPSLSGSDQFDGVAAGATVYYYYGTSDWGPTYGGLPTVALFSPPQIGSRGSARIQNGNFSFTITGVTNQTVVVEASTNLVNWQPVWTNILSGTSTNFTDPRWTNYPNRFYRAQ